MALCLILLSATKSNRDISLFNDSLLSLCQQMVKEDPIQNLKNVLLAHLTYARERRETSFIVIMGAMQFSDTVIRRKISRLIQKYLRKIEKMLSGAVKLGLVKKTINPKISAIAFLGLIQSTVTVWSYKNFNFIPQKIHADLWYVYKCGISV